MTTVTDRAGLDALPVGTCLLDRDGWQVRKVDADEYDVFSRDVKRWLTFDAGEIAGEYADPDEGSRFLPATVLTPELCRPCQDVSMAGRRRRPWRPITPDDVRAAMFPEDTRTP